MEPSLNTWTILFLVAAIQGVFLSIMIFLRRSKTNSLLGFLILSFSVMLLFYVTYWTYYLTLLPSQIGMIQGLTYTFGPLLYCYIRSEKRYTYFKAWHLVPFVIYSIYFLAWPIYPTSWRSQIITTQVIIQNIHLIIYTLLILRFTAQHKGTHNGALKRYKWRKKLALAFSGYTASFLFYYILVWTGTLQIEYDYMISIAASFFIYFIGYYGFQKQEVFKLYENGKYERSALPLSAAQSMLKKLKIYMRNEKPYFDSDLKLQRVANDLQLSSHHISQVINDLEGKSFNDFVNEFRIEEAKLLLLGTDRKIIHIAYDSGFNNKTSFNNTFKKFTNMSPSDFREQATVIV